MRTAGRIAVWVVAIVAVITGGVLLYFSSGPGETFIRDYLAGELSGRLDANVSIERLETDIFSRVEIGGVLIEPLGDPGSSPGVSPSQDAQRSTGPGSSHNGTRAKRSPIERLRIDRLRVRYGLLTLIRGNMEFDSVIVTGAQIALRSDSLPAPEPPPDTSIARLIDERGRFRPPVRIGHAEISGVTLTYDDRSIPMTVSGSGINITAGMDEGMRGDFRLGVDSARVDYFDSPVSVTGLLMSGAINRSGRGIPGAPGPELGRVTPVTIDTFRADVSEMRLEGSFAGGVDSIAGALSISGDPKRLLAAVSDGAKKGFTGGPLQANVVFAIADPLGDPAVRWALSVPSYRVSGVPVSNIRCEGAWRADTLTVAGISFGLFNGFVSGKGWMAADKTMAHNFTLAANGVRISDYWKSRTKPGEFTRIPVTVDARIDSRGRLSSLPDVSANATLNISTGKSLIAAPAMKYSGRHLSIRSEKGMARITADLDVSGKTYDGTVDLSIPSLAALAPIVDARGVDGGFETRALVSGKGSDITIRATATGDDISYKGRQVVDNFFAKVRLEKDEILIDSSAAHGAAVDIGALAKALSAVKTRESVGSQGSDGSSRADERIGSGDGAGSGDRTAPGGTTGVAAPSGSTSLAGTLSYSLSASGPIDNPTASLLTHIEKPAFATLVFDRADIAVSLTDSVMVLKEAAIRKDSSVTSAEGSVDLRDMTGELVAEFRTEGNTAQGSAAPGTSPHDAASPDTIRAHFAYADSADFSLAASSHHFAIATVRRFLPSLPIDGGEIDARVVLRKKGGSLGAEIPFAVTALAVRKGSIDSIAGEIRFADGTFTVDSLTISDKGRRHFVSASVDLHKTADGSYAFDRECPTKGRITGDTIDLASIAPFLAQPPEIGGSVDVELRWDGTVKRPKLRGTLDFRNVRYGPEPRSPYFTGLNGALRIGDGAVRSDSIKATVGKVPVFIAADFEGGDTSNVAASLDVSTAGNLLLSARAGFTGDSLDVVVESRDLDLAVVQPFVDNLRKLKGKLSMELTVKGPVADPVVDGTLDVSGVSFEPGTSGFALTDGAVSARLSAGKLALDSATAVFGGGKVFASGGAVIDSGELKDLDLNLKASGIKVTKSNLYQISVKSTDLNLKSARDRYDLTGTIDFGETRYIRDIEIADVVGMMKPETDVLEAPVKEPLDLMTTVRKSVSEPGKPPGFLQKIDFDVELKNADGLWVDNNLAKFRTVHDLRFQGTFAEATLTGRVSVRDRGELKFLDRRFEIINGVIDCSDPRRLNPIINLTATCDITESSSGNARPTRYTITLTVSGPLDEFDYALTSKPSLEQSDIISLLALGMTQYQLEAGGNKDAVYKDRSEVLASQQISNSVNRFFDNMLGDMLALDHIGIGGNLFDPNQTRFEVTKRWSDRVEVKYSTSITNVDEQILSVEYKINDFLYLEGKSDQKEDSGADLKFRVWFK